MKLFNQYKGLRREIYVLFFGRIVTNMGALIWPMLTLILKNKMGFSASSIATLLLVLSIVQLPCTMLGGRLADRFNKRNVIIVCDLVTVVSYIICAFIKVSMALILLCFVAGLFAAMEGPCYDALVADMSSSKDREKAYSLSYLGSNLGLVLSPTISGLLFENYLNIAFIINAVATLSSTILIYIYIKNLSATKTADDINEYEKSAGADTLIKVLQTRKVITFFLICGGFSSLIYAQFNFLIPLNLEYLYSARGAVYFGLLTSLNAAIVIIGTPIVSMLFSGTRDVTKVFIGEIFIVAALAMYIFIQGQLVMYFISMTIFTVGEVFTTLGKQPYLTRRIPDTHRGRISGVKHIIMLLFQAVGQKGVGALVDVSTYPYVWCAVSLVGIFTIGLYALLIAADKKEYPNLYCRVKSATEKAGVR